MSDIRRFHLEWMNALADTLNRGDTCAPRGMKIKERLAVTVRFSPEAALLYHPDRGLNYRFAVAEWLWMAAESDLVEPLARYNSVMRRFSDDGRSLNGAYGPRLAHQWEYIIKTLKADTDSRQAVASIWTPNPGPSKDIPCTLAAQFLIRRGCLYSNWTMRSSDLWLGLPYDAYTFSRLHAIVAGELGVGEGEMTITAGSSHLYEQHWESATRVLENATLGGTILDRGLPGFPPDSLLDPFDVDDRSVVPYAIHHPWTKYAACLLAPTSDQARDILIAGAV